MASRNPPHSLSPLTQQVQLPESDEISMDSAISDEAWIDVIQRMDDIYADLVGYQVELEEKNAALEDAHRFIQSVNSSMSDVLVVCDINGKIQQVNRALERFTGKPASQLAGKPLVTLFSQEHATMVEDFAEHIRSDSVIDCEVDLIDAQGNASPMAINCNARFDHEDRLSGLVLTGRPLGELRRAYTELHKAHEELKIAQRQLVQSEKMASLGRLVAGVAHELNNPISFVFGNMHALKRYEQRLQTYLSAIHSNKSDDSCEELRQKLKVDRMMQDIGPLIEGSLEGAERVSEIVQNLRRFTTPQEQQPREFDLITVAKSAVQWLVKASRRKPELHTDIPEELLVYNREGPIHQILINLVQNAFDALENKEHPLVELGAGTDNGKAWISIRDNGSGIAEEDALKIFDPFFTTKPVGKGTGLGLYISYGLATDRCEGDLRFSNHPDGGAIFTLEVPMRVSG